MISTLPASTLENRLPIYRVENDCIITKGGDYGVAFRVELPELFTKTEKEYEAIHSSWVRAVKVLPHYTVLHKQDWFLEDTYTPQYSDESSFLDKAFQRHFIERPYTEHYCYLYLIKTSPQTIRKQSVGTTLAVGDLIPKDILDKDGQVAFMESVNQFKAIIESGGHIKLVRLKKNDIVGTPEKTGLIEKYLSLSNSNSRLLEDIELNPKGVVVGNKHTCLFTISSEIELPDKVASDLKYDRLSTENSTCNLSFTSPLGLLLPYDHIVNQYLFIDDPQRLINQLEKEAKNMNTLAKMSRANAINSELIEGFLNEINTTGQVPIRSHVNVLAWSDNPDKLSVIKNDVASAISVMGATPRHNVTDAPVLFWSGIPGNGADFPSEETFKTTIEQAVCFFTNETNYRSSLSPFGMKMVDRFGKPLHIDISDEPMRRGIITNRNKFILGPSGSGKSFFTNHMARQYYEQNSHVMLVDVGHSYEGLCKLINYKTRGEDGIYITYEENNPITFNPFYTDDGVFSVEKKQSIVGLLFTLWKPSEHHAQNEKNQVSDLVSKYIQKLQSNPSIRPCFDTFYRFLIGEYYDNAIRLVEGEDGRVIEGVREQDFNFESFRKAMQPFYKGGEYDFLLNSEQNIDLLNKRFVVFELDNIKDHPVLFPVITIIIMEAYLSKLRRLHGSVRKVLILEEAWKAIMNETMAVFIKDMFKTARKHYGEVIVVTQEIDDIKDNPIVKDTIINNSDCKILLDQAKYANRFEDVERTLALSKKQRSQILSINKNIDPKRKYKEVYIDLGGNASAVYATEVSLAEYYIYTTEKKEKVAVMELAETVGGDIEYAVKLLIEQNEK